MRIHRLTLTAIGPFPGTEHIDFDALSADGLFLLHGRTGSGKTMVLDAVTFALYGDVPGQRDVAGLHSHHARAQSEPSVELEFTQSQRRWFIRRTPPHRRVSQRAKSGFVSVNQTVLLKTFHRGEWQEVTSGVQAAAKEIQDILPLDRHQFTKVILLPQGEFAQFLHATSTEKQKLLQKLFDTTLYQRLETELNDRAKVLRERIDRADHQVQVAARVVRSQAQTMVEPLLGAELSGFGAVGDEDLIEAVELLGAWAERDIRQAAHSAAAHQEHAADAAEVVHHRRTVLHLLSDHQARQANHERQRIDVDRRRSDLARHRQATELHRWFDQAEALERDQHEQRGRVDHEIIELQRIIADQDDVDSSGEVTQALRTSVEEPDADPLESLLTELVELRGGLAQQDAAALEQRRSVAEAELSSARTGAAEQRTVLQTTDEEITSIEARQQHLTASWEDLETLQERRSREAERVEIHRRRVSLSARLTEQRRVAERVAVDAAQAVQEEEAADARRRRLLAAYLRTVARRLAADLVTGQPCLVCGALEHPAPADHPLRSEASSGEQRPQMAGGQAAGDEVEAIGEEDVEQATALLHQATQVRAAAESTCAGVEQTVRRLSDELVELTTAGQGHPGAGEAEGQEHTTETITADLDGAQRGLHQLEEDIRAQRERVSEHSELREQHAEASRRRLTVEHGLERYGAAIDRLTEEVSSQDEVLTRLRGTHASVEERFAALDQLHTRGSQTQATVTSWRQARVWAQRARQSANDQLEDSELADMEQLRAAVLDEEVQRTHQEQIKHWDTQHQRLALAEESAEIKAARSLRGEGVSTPTDDEMAAAQQRADSAADQRRQTQTALERFEDRLCAARDAGSGLDEALRSRDDELAGHRRLSELAATLNGTGQDNPRRMTLTSYVLAARLEKVAVVATRHLQTMSEGRYRLLHDATEGGGRRQGLELKVHDEHNDHERSTASLSGGETFMASLAMALGLAEVVQSEAGGIGLESLFIDEGFGSLDEESLDHVMEALHRLQGEGRRVGVVSHVSEMHRAIPTQLRIIRRRTGSAVRMLLPGDIGSPQHAGHAAEG